MESYKKPKVKTCKYCNKQYTTLYYQGKYCSKDCDIKDKTEKKYDGYLENQAAYCEASKNMKFVKKHILKEQGNSCSVCKNLNEWNGKTIVFILDHIDGDASNNKRDNLRLVCPNCDSQLDTYKSKNKNSARKSRYLLNYKQ
jgi:hypothetical protein